MPTRPSIHRVLMLVAAAACWGVGTVVTKQVLADVAPLTLLPLQLAASCVFLLVVSMVGRTRVTWSPQLRRLTALGVINPGLAYLLGLLGLASITASMSVLLWATEPLLILLLAVLLLRERVAAGLVVTMAVAVLGVLLIGYQPSAAGSGAGVALTLAGVLACALYTVLARRLLLDDASVLVALLQQTAALGFSVVVLMGAMAAAGGELEIGAMSASDWVGATASGVLYYGLAFWFYLAGLRQVPASVAGSFLTLVPVFGVAGGHLVGERLSTWQWTGAAVVVMAVAGVVVRQGDGRDLTTKA